jgi:hypothetical protein|nr:MAG TPA_asm: hypothetical protein [Caudoviricetes sp.]
MPLKEPTPPEKIFTDEFAKSGEVKKVPNDLQSDESLSWLGGFTKRFSRIPVKENGLNMIRQTFAGIVQPLSGKILQVEKDLRVRFLKADKAKIKNNDISFLETPQLTMQNLNAKKAKIVDFTKELIKPSEKTIITDLTQNAGVISGIDTLTIADKAKSVNIILSPTTSQSVLNNTPPNDAAGKELVNAEWVIANYGIAPSPYIHTFNGNSTTIPYNKIRGLKYLAIESYCVHTGSPSCQTGLFELAGISSCYQAYGSVDFLPVATHYNRSNLEFKAGETIRVDCVSMSSDCWGCFFGKYLIMSERTEKGIHLEIEIEGAVCSGECDTVGMCVVNPTVVFFNK